MLNLVTADNLTESMKSGAMRRIDESLTNVAYSHWLAASELSYVSGTPVLSAPSIANGPGYWTFHEGASGYVGAYIRRPVDWRDGFVYAKLHWSAAEASTDAVWRFGATPVPLLPLSATVPALGYELFTVTSESATAMMVSNLKSGDLNTSSTINSKHSGLAFYLGKHATPSGDTMTVDRRVYGIEIIYLERDKRAGNYDPGTYEI